MEGDVADGRGEGIVGIQDSPEIVNPAETGMLVCVGVHKIVEIGVKRVDSEETHRMKLSSLRM
jgi:hypothetical protein